MFSPLSDDGSRFSVRKFNDIHSCVCFGAKMYEFGAAIGIREEEEFSLLFSRDLFPRSCFFQVHSCRCSIFHQENLGTRGQDLREMMKHRHHREGRGNGSFLEQACPTVKFCVS